jgi:hypothetical protein
MLYRLRTGLKRSLFTYQIRSIFKTPPLQIRKAPWAIISMVATHDVPMYLLSMKSFYQRVGRGRLIAIIDRDMPEDSRQTLQRHFLGIEFLHLEDIDTGVCQRGGTWERLIYLLDHSKLEYAIQVDSDTLAFGSDLAEIISCAETNRPFVLSNQGRPIMTMAESAKDARAVESDHICIVAERFFDRYPDLHRYKYVRASSGLAGFSKGGIERGRIEEFHENMRALHGERWNEWGSEMVSSNFAIANSPNALVLPYPKYANFWPGFKRGNSSFLHFIGTHRYLDGYFAGLGQNVISELTAASSQGAT